MHSYLNASKKIVFLYDLNFNYLLNSTHKFCDLITMNTPDKTNWFEKLAPYSLIIFIILLWVFYPIALSWINTKWPEIHLAQTGTTFGTFGDTYGALNTLFSGLAFAILILSLFLQRKELQAQRKELSAQRGEIAKSNEIAEQQRIITEQQKILNEQQIKDAQIKNFYDLLFRFLNRFEIKYSKMRKVSRSDGEYNYFNGFNNSTLAAIENLLGNIELLENTPLERINLIIKNSLGNGNKQTFNKIIDEQFYEQIIFIINFISEHNYLKVSEFAFKIFDSYLNKHEKLTILLGSFEHKELRLFAQQYSDFFNSDLPENIEPSKVIMELAINSKYAV